jgi:hypothetical protein
MKIRPIDPGAQPQPAAGTRTPAASPEEPFAAVLTRVKATSPAEGAAPAVAEPSPEFVKHAEAKLDAVLATHPIYEMLPARDAAALRELLLDHLVTDPMMQELLQATLPRPRPK